MPKLWNETIEEHRQAVRDAIMETAWRLVSESGLTSVTMSSIAKETGIGRATLYKYFADVEAILLASHERHVAEHLERLQELRDAPGDPVKRLADVLRAYAMISYRREQSGPGLVALLHGGPHVLHAQQELLELVRDLLSEARETGRLRVDVPSDELATFCLHALAAASALRSEAAVRRLVDVTLSGLRR